MLNPCYYYFEDEMQDQGVTPFGGTAVLARLPHRSFRPRVYIAEPFALVVESR